MGHQHWRGRGEKLPTSEIDRDHGDDVPSWQGNEGAGIPDPPKSPLKLLTERVEALEAEMEPTSAAAGSAEARVSRLEKRVSVLESRPGERVEVRRSPAELKEQWRLSKSKQRARRRLEVDREAARGCEVCEGGIVDVAGEWVACGVCQGSGGGGG